MLLSTRSSSAKLKSALNGNSNFGAIAIVSDLKVAIMQPYFIPYAGYFRLMAATDLFVIYDCVQFPRRGWVHRNYLLDNQGQSQWFTLPLEKMKRHARIGEMIFRQSAVVEMAAEMRRFPIFSSSQFTESAFASVFNLATQVGPLQFIVRLLEVVCDNLKIPFNVVFSSSLNIDPLLRGQDRILAITHAVGAKIYVNSPGGRGLYQASDFVRQNLELKFLRTWQGPMSSVLNYIGNGSCHSLMNDIRLQCELDN